MKYFLLLLLLTGSLYVQGQSFNYRKDYEKISKRSKDPSDQLYYPGLLSRFLRQDSSLTVTEMLALMIGYTALPGFRPYQDLETEKLVYRLNNEAKYKEVIGICDTFLSRHPLNQAAIIEKAFAFYQLKNTDSATFYKEQFGRIMATMDRSGSGHSPDEAVFSIGPRDGRNFIDKYYHADLGRNGSAEDSEGNFCDMLEMKFKKGSEQQSVVLYFAIQHAVNTTASSNTRK